MADVYFRQELREAPFLMGKYKVLKNAKAKADANPGYSVFDADGNAVYTTVNVHVNRLRKRFDS